MLNSFIFYKNDSTDVHSVVFLEVYPSFMSSFNWSSSFLPSVVQQDLEVWRFSWRKCLWCYSPNSRALPSPFWNSFCCSALQIPGLNRIFVISVLDINYLLLIPLLDFILPYPCPAGKGCFAISVQKMYLKAE